MAKNNLHNDNSENILEPNSQKQTSQKIFW